MFSTVNKLPSGLLEFRTMSKKFPWHLIILLGSGFALAEACKVSHMPTSFPGPSPTRAQEREIKRQFALSL